MNVRLFAAGLLHIIIGVALVVVAAVIVWRLK